jgi:glycosyltransferase involved in cell wall biosynthesis
MNYSIVIPTFNNASQLETLLLSIEISMQDSAFEVLIIDDGCTDNTWVVLTELKKRFNFLKIIRLAKNFGQHAATICGFSHAYGEFVITMDDDFEIHSKEIHTLIKAQENSKTLVTYGVFKAEENWQVALLKRAYRCISKLNGKNKGKGSSFRLIEGNLVRKMAAQQHNFAFVDELLLWYTDSVSFVPVQYSGKSTTKSRYKLPALVKSTLRLMLFASDLPLKFVSFLGLSLSTVNFLYACFIFYKRVVHKIEVEGYTSLILSILFSSGIIIFSLGVLAQYLRQMLLKMNQKPLYYEAEVAC